MKLTTEGVKITGGARFQLTGTVAVEFPTVIVTRALKCAGVVLKEVSNFKAAAAEPAFKGEMLCTLSHPGVPEMYVMVAAGIPVDPGAKMEIWVPDGFERDVVIEDGPTMSGVEASWVHGTNWTTFAEPGLDSGEIGTFRVWPGWNTPPGGLMRTYSFP